MQTPKIIKSFRKTLAISVKNAELIVKAPHFTTKKTITNFLEKHKSWIEKNLKRQRELKRIELSDDEIQKYKNLAKKIIPLRVKYYADKFDLKYNKVKITSAKSRWGSCSSKKNLNFSYRLLLASKEALDYVVVHELSHLIHMNHSKKFWSHVEMMMPEYKKYEKELKGLNIG